MKTPSGSKHSSFRVGLTGGIASGKSTVADILGELGADIIDTDVIARAVVEPGQPALDEIRRHFGDGIVADDGTLDRRALRKLIFADDGQRKKLESILHPRIGEMALAQAEAANGPYQVVVVPLLAGSPLRATMDRILVVDCSEENQLERLLLRDSESEQQARSIIAAQSSRDERLAIADDLIHNDGTLEELRTATVAMHRQYLDLAATTRTTHG